MYSLVLNDIEKRREEKCSVISATDARVISTIFCRPCSIAKNWKHFDFVRKMKQSLSENNFVSWGPEEEWTQ